MIFNEDYYHPMDREYDIAIPAEPMPHEPPEAEETDEVGYGVKDIGMSIPLGIAAQNVQGVQAKLRGGMKSVELQFSGVSRSSRNQQTPGIYGEDQRRALREIKKAEEVEFTTHATFGIMGLSGADQQGNFSWQYRKMALDEVKRAIEFASDTAGGGSVVVHVGEFDRPLATQSWAKDENGRITFRRYLHEPYDAQYKVLDDRSGQVMTTVSRDRLVARAKWMAADSDMEGTDQDGNACFIKKGDYIDYEGRKIIDPDDPKRGKVPEFDKATGRFRVEMWHFDDFVKESEQRNRVEEERLGRPVTPQEMILPEELYLKATLETQEGHSRGWALQYGEGFERNRQVLEKLQEAKKFYEKIDKNMPEEEKWKIMKQSGLFANMTEGILPPETKHPLEIIEDKINEFRKRVEFEYQSSLSQEQQAEDLRETRKHIISQTKRMYSAGYRSYAEAGIHAMNKSHDPKNPLVVTMEHIFPERYGGHPEELKELIYNSRKNMKELLTAPYREEEIWNPKTKKYEITKIENEYYKRGLSEKEATNMAERHIKATLDTAHLNIWRKYYVPDSNLTPEQNDKKFDSWVVNQVEGLAKEGMIGNVHLSDNFGYEDEHLAPGQGNAPIKNIMKVLKKYGYNKSITVEPGAPATTDLGDFYGLMQTWRHFGSPVYSGEIGRSIGMGGGAAPSRSWTDVQYSYFGQTYAPYFVFGAYSPSNDWTLWSGVPME